MRTLNSSSLPLEIVVTPDHGYAGPCAAMLHSMLCKASKPSQIRVNLLRDPSLTRQDVDGLKSVCVAQGARMMVVDPPSGVLAKLPVTNRYPAATWYRLFLPEFLPAHRRVLYLDSDLLILGDVFELWAQGACSKAIAAVVHPLFGYISTQRIHDLGVKDVARFFNSGVMLMDLEILASYMQRFCDFIHTGGVRLDFADQDVFNAFFSDAWMPLHPKWNVQLPFFELRPERLPCDTVLACEARTMPQIVHFTGTIKPWHYRCNHPYKGAFWSHLRATPWKDMQYQQKSLKNLLLRPLPTWVIPTVKATLRR